MVVFKTPGEPRKHGRGPSSLNAVCLIHNDLLSDTCYKFSVRAHNNAGDSDVSQPIQCITLRETQSKLKGNKGKPKVHPMLYSMCLVRYKFIGIIIQ